MKYLIASDLHGSSEYINKLKEQFLEKAAKVHNGKYDYSKVEYVDRETKVCIICPKHGEFWQSPNAHLRGKGCKRCSMEILWENKKKITTEFLGDSYQFFGQGSVYINGSKDCEITEQVDTTTIEYFMLDVEVEKVDNPLDYLDERFKEIEAKKKPATPILISGKVYDPKKEGASLIPNWNTVKEDKDEDFYSWIHSKDKKESDTKEGILFDDKTMDDLKVEINWTPNPTLVHEAIVRMIACSFIIDPSKFDLKQWIVRHMERKYNDIFKEALSFDNWAEFVIEFVLTNFYDETAPDIVYEDLDEYQSMVAEAIYDELSEYADQNSYIRNYLEILQRYM